MSNNYLVIQNENGGTISRYQRNLLKLNQVCGLMRTEIREVDNRVYYCYDINDKTSLLSLVRKQSLEYKEVKAFLQCCIQTIEGAKMYLMEEDNFILIPEFIFFTEKAQEVVLCYMDRYQKEIRQQFYELVEFLLNHINYKDQSCVRMVYELFQLLGKENTTFYEMKRVIAGETQEKTVETLCKEEKQPYKEEDMIDIESLNWNKDQIKPESQQVFIQSEPKWKKSIVTYKWLVLGSLTVVAFVLMVVVIWFGLLNKKGSTQIDAVKAIAFFGLLGSIVIYLYSKIASLEKKSVKTDDALKQSYLETEQIYEKEESCRLIDFNQNNKNNFYINQFPFVIGKDKNQVNGIIPSDVISRIHAKLTVRNGQFYIEDLHSTNGTFVNGQKLRDKTPFMLHQQDEIALGNVRYLFQIEE